MIGTTVSHYKILEKLGEGGMGVVYKAEDQKLKRMVALKFLPERVGANEPDKARFMQEAQAAAALNHPNICTIYGIDEFDGKMFIAMELIDGQTLREKKGSIGFKQAIDIGIQLAEGLAAAHEKGIVHRDIKPDNIMIRKDGIAQIMDFGLAKLRGVSKLTKEGSTVGTAGYMSPEQVQGQEADHRSDIFSLGVVLYELITGQLPFKGVHETALLYEIVNVDVAPMSSVKPELDPSLDAIVLECLDKDPNERAQSAKQIAIDLKRFKRETGKTRVSMIRPAVAVLPSQSKPLSSDVLSVRERWMWAGALAVVFCWSVYVFLTRDSSRGSDLPSVSFTIPPPPGTVIKNTAVSPDGKKIAFTVIENGITSLWVRPLHNLEAQPLQGTDNAEYPFWSPDSRSIGFFADGKVKRIDGAGGQALSICDAPSGLGGSWNQFDEILLAPSVSEGLFLVNAGGGTPKRVTTLDSSRNEGRHSWPYFLPDGRKFLYFGSGVADDPAPTYLSSLDDTSRIIVLTSQVNALFAPPSHILFLKLRTLTAQSFDPGSGRLLGDPYPVASSVGIIPLIQLGDFSYSPAGVLTTGHGRAVNREYGWFDRKGAPLGSACPPANYYDVGVHSSGKQAAVQKVDVVTNNSDIWTVDLNRNLISRFTFDAAVEDDPVWSADGKYIYFSNTGGGTYNIFRKPANGIGNPEMVTEAGRPKKPRDCSKDGRYLLYEVNDPLTRLDAWVLPLDEPGKPFPFLQSAFDEEYPQFSPDGKWVAYASNESGKPEVYVQSFPAGAGRWQISTNGGSQPRWNPNGQELFYIGRDLKLMGVEVRSGTSFEIGAARALFQTRIDTYTGPNRYSVIDDGKKFLINIPVEEELVNPIRVLIHPLNRDKAPQNH